MHRCIAMGITEYLFCCVGQQTSTFFFFFYFADRVTQYIYLNVNQLDALNFIMSLFHASTCFEHHALIIRRSKLYYAASGIITPIGVINRCDDTILTS